MKRNSPVRYRKSTPQPGAVRDASVRSQPTAEATVSVRTAKATLSALLEQVAGGREVVITSDGRPKARLVPVGGPRVRRVFPGSAGHLARMPAWLGGADATEIISGGRDDRE